MWFCVGNRKINLKKIYQSTLKPIWILSVGCSTTVVSIFYCYNFMNFQTLLPHIAFVLNCVCCYVGCFWYINLNIIRFSLIYYNTATHKMWVAQINNFRNYSRVKFLCNLLARQMQWSPYDMCVLRNRPFKWLPKQ